MLVQGDVNESTCSYITPTFMCVSHARAASLLLAFLWNSSCPGLILLLLCP